MTNPANNFARQYGPWALIAGGSEGIGLAFAKQLAQVGINLILLGRRTSALQTARQALANYDVAIETHSIDLSNAIDGEQLQAITADKEIGLLIYNAGATHGAELFHERPLDDALGLIQLNCHSPTTLCHLLGQAMRLRRRGGILLMSSMSGLTGGAYIASYCATKSFDIILAEGLYQELQPFGVHVMALIAGATDTPAMARSGIDIGQAMAADDVAREGLAALGSGPVLVAGENNRAASVLFRDANRDQTSTLMSQATAGMYGKSFPPR